MIKYLTETLRRLMYSSADVRAAAAVIAAEEPEVKPVYNIPPEWQEVWRKIEEYPFDEPGAAYPFSARLAKRNSWRQDWDMKFALRVLAEYRKFQFLLIAPGHMVTPSLAVDEAWHIHLLYTKSYWHDFCRDIAGKEIHHHPGNGNDDDTLKWRAIYERTLEYYQQYFGTPPEDIWGRPDPTINWREILPQMKKVAPLNPMKPPKPTTVSAS